MNVCETLEGDQAAASSQEDTDPVSDNVDGIVPSEKVELDSDGVKESCDASADEAATSGPGETSGDAVGDTASSKDIHEQPASHQESVVFDLDVDDHDDGTSRLNLETPEREDGSTRGEEEEEEEVGETVPPTDQDDDRISYEEQLRLHQELSEERDEAVAHGAQLQTRLAEHLRRNTPDQGRLESEQPEAYKSHLHLLSEMRRQLSEASESAQQQVEQLRLQCQEKQEKVHLTTRCFRLLDSVMCIDFKPFVMS